MEIEYGKCEWKKIDKRLDKLFMALSSYFWIDLERNFSICMLVSVVLGNLLPLGFETREIKV